jgi:hypothetical protein
MFSPDFPLFQSRALVTKKVEEKTIELKWVISIGSNGWKQLVAETKIVGILIFEEEPPECCKNWWKGISDVVKVNRETLESISVWTVQNPKYATFFVNDLCIDLNKNETLTSLTLRNCGINSQLLIQLADVLRENKSLTNLNLSANSVWGPGMKKLSEVLQLNHTIEKLDLSSNQIEVTSWQDFCDSLDINRSLTQLNLSNSKLGNFVPVLSQALQKNRYLWSITLSHNELGFTEISQLCDSFVAHPHLNHIDISNNDLKDESAKKIADIIRGGKNLSSIDLSFSSFEVDGIQIISEAVKSNEMIRRFNIKGGSPMYISSYTGYRLTLLLDSIFDLNPQLLDSNLRSQDESWLAIDGKESKKKIVDILNRNTDAAQIRIRSVVKALIVLQSDSLNPDSNSLWSLLPSDLQQNVFGALHYHPHETVGKTPVEINLCATFIRQHMEMIKKRFQDGFQFTIFETYQRFKFKFQKSKSNSSGISK